jgi:hypothetical protein
MKYSVKFSKKSITACCILIFLASASIVIAAGTKRYIRKQQTRLVVDIEKLPKSPQIDYTKLCDPSILKFKSSPIITLNSWVKWDYSFSPETFILTISHGRAMSEYPIILVEDKYILSNFFWGWEPRKSETQIPRLDCKFIPGRVAAINATHRNIYGHWMLDILPKIKMLKDSNIEYDWLYTTIPSPGSYQQRSLELLGVDMKKIINGAEYPYIEGEILIVPSWPGPNSFYQRWVIDYIRTEMFSRVRPATMSFSKKIFVSREKSSRRRFDNEEELFSQLKDIGFTRYYLEDLTFDDQIHLFANADVVISPQGSSLINIIFCKPETAVVEIFQSLGDEYYCHLSQILQLRYTGVQTVPFSSVFCVAESQDTHLSEKNINDILYAVNNPPSLKDSPQGIKLQDILRQNE